MLSDEMRKYLDVLDESSHLEEMPNWLKGALAAGAFTAGLQMTALDNEPFAKWLEYQIEHTQDAALKAKMQRDYDRFVLSDVEATDTKALLNKYGWKDMDEIPDWAKKSDEVQPSLQKSPAKNMNVKFSYDQRPIKPM